MVGTATVHRNSRTTGTMTFVIITIGTVLLLFGAASVRKLAARPIKYRGLRLDEIGPLLDSFLLQAGVGSVFTLQRESGPGFLQLLLTRRHQEWHTLEFGLPDAFWSRRYFDIVQKDSETQGHRCRVELDANNSDVPRFLRVEIRGTRQELGQRLHSLLPTIAGHLEFGPAERYTAQLVANISPEYRQHFAEQLESLADQNVVTRILTRLIRGARKKRAD